MLIDLHAHTTASDGALAPAALVELARREGVGVLGVTDHDSVAGLDEAMAAGARLGVDVVPGLEISSYYHRREVHLLGYFVDHRRPDLLEQLAVWRAERVERMRQMVERLRRYRIHLDADRIAARDPAGSVGRPHVAQALVEGGHVATVEEAFDRFLAEGKPAYVPRERVVVADAVALVRRSGGVPTLAHPGIYHNDGMVAELVRDGLAGIEVVHRDHNAAAEERYRRLAARYDLVCTGGSDYHGLANATPQRLGHPSLPPADLEALRARHRSSP